MYREYTSVALKNQVKIYKFRKLAIDTPVSTNGQIDPRLKSILLVDEKKSDSIFRGLGEQI